MLIHSPLIKIHSFVCSLHKASIDSFLLALLDHGKNGKVLLHRHNSKHEKNHNPQKTADIYDINKQRLR